MEWLNYHHLYYFWTIAREGGVGKAAARLHLTQPTLSGQLKALEDAMGTKLFHRQGRQLVLTEAGQTAFRYCEEIFTLGREMSDVLKGRVSAAPSRLVVGLADVVPKLVAARLLDAVCRMPSSPRLVVREDRSEALVAELAVHRLDVVITDAPLTPSIAVRAWNHLLGECGVTFFRAPGLVLPEGFPAALQGAPLILPLEGSTLRRGLELWFEAQGIRPRVVAEIEDSALVKTLAQQGFGVCVAPTAIAGDVSRQYGLVPIGSTEAVRERFYAITVERRLRHPALVALASAAPGVLSGTSGKPM